MQILFSILTVLFFFASLALVIIILVQRPQGGGLSAAFGGSGGGGGETAFGGRTGDALTITTVTAFVVYLVLAVGLNILDKQMSSAAMEVRVDTTPVDAPGTGAPPATIEIPGGKLERLDGPPPGFGGRPPATQPVPPAAPPAASPGSAEPAPSNVAPPADVPPASPTTPPPANP